VGLFHIYFIFVHTSPYLFVCGDNRVTCYPGADDVTSEPRDAQWRRVGAEYKRFVYKDFYVIFM